MDYGCIWIYALGHNYITFISLLIHLKFGLTMIKIYLHNNYDKLDCECVIMIISIEQTFSTKKLNVGKRKRVQQ